MYLSHKLHQRWCCLHCSISDQTLDLDGTFTIWLISDRCTRISWADTISCELISDQRDLNFMDGHSIQWKYHKNQEISILTTKKNQSKVNTSSTSHREFQKSNEKTENKGPRNKTKIEQNKTPKQYKQHASLTPVQEPCMISITISPLTSSAPYSGWRPVKTLTCTPSFCCKSRNNGKTQPCCWLATNNNTSRWQKTG